MTSFSHSVKALAIAVITTIASSATVMAQSLDKPFTVVEPAQIQWKDAGKGVKFACVPVASHIGKASRPF